MLHLVLPAAFGTLGFRFHLQFQQSLSLGASALSIGTAVSVGVMAFLASRPQNRTNLRALEERLTEHAKDNQRQYLVDAIARLLFLLIVTLFSIFTYDWMVRVFSFYGMANSVVLKLFAALVAFLMCLMLTLTLRVPFLVADYLNSAKP
ncbi:hypothetical protein [Citreimonas sp.]|uniref:hypothetical protein n=1 Tax=Citreimonas sp. TaxID=3036715 RepID=UPI0040593FA8